MLIAALTFFFYLLAGAMWGIMDLLQFHYHESKFSDKENQGYWNPDVSWENKWKWVWDDKKQRKVRVEKFWKSSTWFVRFTDAWHNYKSFTLTALAIVGQAPQLTLIECEVIWWAQLITPLGMWIGFWITFESKLLRK